MNKGFWAVIAVIAVIFGGILVFQGDKANAPSGGNSSATASNHVKGEGTKGVTLIEYGDFQCSACASYEPIVQAVFEKYKNDITFQFRNLPLLQIHQNAFAAARAAEAADMQGKFWEMHDLLYQNQKAWEQSGDALDIFEQYAGQLGLDVAKFKKDAASSKANDIINADIAAFEKTGEVKSTPTFLLDGKKVTPNSLDAFSKLIDEAIAKKASTTNP
jgi:protein-disulfide isomerase